MIGRKQFAQHGFMLLDLSNQFIGGEPTSMPFTLRKQQGDCMRTQFPPIFRSVTNML